MKQTIEEAAKQYAKSQGDDNSFNHFSMGAHSQASKEFHTQGMYSEEDLKEFFRAGMRYQNEESEYNSDMCIEEIKKKKNEST